MTHARVFLPVASSRNERLCSRDCKHRRTLPKYSWWSTFHRWWRGTPDIEAACRFFDHPLAVAIDGDHWIVERHHACLESDHLLPTVEQYIEATSENVTRLPARGDFDERRALPSRSEYAAAAARITGGK